MFSCSWDVRKLCKHSKERFWSINSLGSAPFTHRTQICHQQTSCQLSTLHNHSVWLLSRASFHTGGGAAGSSWVKRKIMEFEACGDSASLGHIFRGADQTHRPLSGVFCHQPTRTFLFLFFVALHVVFRAPLLLDNCCQFSRLLGGNKSLKTELQSYRRQILSHPFKEGNYFNSRKNNWQV